MELHPSDRYRKPESLRTFNFSTPITQTNVSPQESGCGKYCGNGRQFRCNSWQTSAAVFIRKRTSITSQIRLSEDYHQCQQIVIATSVMMLYVAPYHHYRWCLTEPASRRQFLKAISSA